MKKLFSILVAILIASTTLTYNVSANTTPIFHFGVKHTITYNLNGGTNSINNPEEFYEGVGDIDLEPATKENYEFDGWYLESTFNTLVPTISDDTDHDVVLYAKFTSVNYTISYHLDGGTNNQSNPASYTAETNTIPLLDPSKVGYSFDGWYLENTFDTKVTSIIPSEYLDDIDLYAKWSASTNTAYTVKHHTQKLDDSYEIKETENLSGTTGASVTPSVKSYTGFTAPTTQAVTISADGSTTVDYYYTRNSYTLSLTKGKGIDSLTGDGTYKYEQEVTINPTLKAGYENPTYTGDATSSSFLMPAKDASATVSASPITYTITYILDDGTNNQSNPASYTAETNTISLFDPTKEGYSFDGWYLENTFDTKVTSIIPSEYLDDIDLYAKWSLEAPTKYLVTVQASSNAAASGQGEYSVDDNVTVKAVNLIDGYVFDGWFNCVEGEATGDALSTNETYSFSMPSENVDLIAVYHSDITYNLNVTGSMFTINGSQEYDEYLGIISSGTNITVEYNDTNQFVYWKNESNMIVSTNPSYTFIFTSNTSLTAVTTNSNVYKYAFVSAYGQIMKLGTYRNNETVLSPNPPSKPGSNFKAWKIRGTSIEIDIKDIGTSLKDYVESEPKDKYIYLDPVYEKIAGHSTLTIKYEGVTKQDSVVDFAVEGRQQITVEASIGGKEFSYWMLNNQIVAYTNQFNFYTRIGEDNTIVAVYGVSVTPEPLLSVVSLYSGNVSGTNKIMDILSWSSPNGYTTQEVGVLATDNAQKATPATMTTSGEGFQVTKANTDNASIGTYSYSVSVKDANKVIYLRGYLTYTDSVGTSHTVYTDIVSGSINSLSN